MSLTLQPEVLSMGLYMSDTYGIIYITYQPCVGPMYLKLNNSTTVKSYTDMSGFNSNSIFAKGLTLLKETHIPNGTVVSEFYPEFFI